MALRLRFMSGANPRLAPLRDGTVTPEGIELEWVEPPSGLPLFQHNLRFDDLEVAEMSISESLVARERRSRFGQGKWDWAYIPSFLGRGHNWDRMLVAVSSSMRGLADLKGKRVAVRDYSMTSMVWLRAMLKDLHGIEAGDVVWYNIGNRGKDTGLDKEPPRGVELHWLGEGDDAPAMLERGELDAVHDAPRGKLDAGRVRRLFPDGSKELVFDYFRKTGCYQANHHYVIQKRILKEKPWAARALYDGFERSKQVAYERARQAASAYLYFEGRDFEAQAAVLGDDPFPSGIAANRRTLERLCRASYEQGLIATPASVEEAYAGELLST